MEVLIEEIQAQIDSANAIISKIVEGGIDEGEIEKYLEYRARLISMQKELGKAKDEKGGADSSREADKSENSWQKLYGTLRKVGKEFDEIGEAVGGTAGEAIKTAGTIASSTLSSISAITQLANWSITATEMAAQGASKAIIAVERASVILAVIGAVMKAVTAITGLFKDNEEQLRAAAEAAREYETALAEIRRSQRYDLFDTIFGTDGIGKFQEAKDIALESLDDIEDEVNGIRNRTQNVLGKVIANPIEATYDGRSGWNKFWGSGDHKIKNVYFDVNEYFNADGSIGDKQLEALQKWYDAHGNALDSSEKEILERLIANGEAYAESVQVMTDHIEQLWGELASSIAENMIDAFLETGDAAANLGELVDDVARNMAKSMIESLLIMGDPDLGIEGIFNDNLQTQLLDLLKIGDQTGANELIQDAIESAGELGPIIEGIVTSLGLMSDKAGVAQSGKAGAYQTMSQDTGTELKGLFTAMRMSMEDMKAGIDGIGPGLSEATGVLVEIREEVRKSNSWLGKIHDRIEKIIRDGLKVE